MPDAGDRAQAGLQAARVGRAHGLDGSFYVTGPLTRLLTHGASITIDGRPATIVRRAGTDRRPIVRLEGVCDRAAAEALRGAAIAVAQEQAPQLDDDEWWAHELEGCAVVDQDGRALGTVARLIALPSCEVLEVPRASDVQPLLVPMVKDAIRQVDVAARRIVIDAGFLDVDPDGGARGAA